MAGKLGIFWTTEEKNVVLAAARTLRERQPRSTLKQVGIRAQATLPKQRRRPVNNKLTSWLSTSLKGGSPIAGQLAREGHQGSACPSAAHPTCESGQSSTRGAVQHAADVDRARRRDLERHPAPSERAGRVGKYVTARARFAQALTQMLPP